MTKALLVLAFITNGQPQATFHIIEGGSPTSLENAVNICNMQGVAWIEEDTLNHVVFQCHDLPKRKEM